MQCEKALHVKQMRWAAPAKGKDLHVKQAELDQASLKGLLLSTKKRSPQSAASLRQRRIQPPIQSVQSIHAAKRWHHHGRRTGATQKQLAVRPHHVRAQRHPSRGGAAEAAGWSSTAPEHGAGTHPPQGWPDPQSNRPVQGGGPTPQQSILAGRTRSKTATGPDCSSATDLVPAGTGQVQP